LVSASPEGEILKGHLGCLAMKMLQIYRLSTINDWRSLVASFNGKENTELAGLGWALAHPARIQLLRLLLARGGCVCGELVAELNLAQSTVSQHLKILRDAGLIQGEVDGPRVCYCANPQRFQDLKRLVVELESLSQNRRSCDGKAADC
jgi:ArsR family transcriptional regulator